MIQPRFPSILVTGGAGYVGTRLVPQLLARGHSVRVYDAMFYGCELVPQPGLTLIRDDIRETSRLAEAFAGVDAVIHLACVSNDAGFELDEKLSQSINFDCFEPMVVAAKAASVRRFVYASSSSVYGISDKLDVTEDHPLVPLTLYNKFKGMCEVSLLRHHSPDFVCVTIRPATVCGYSPRQRLDLSVNILTNQAVNAGRITVFGGAQLRPNLHIQDMCDLYQLLLDVDDAPIAGETFNAGYQNMSIADIALAVRRVVAEEFPGRKPVEIGTTPTDDIRSYHINSEKIARTIGFRPRHSVEDAVRDLCRAFREGRLPDSLADERYFNVKILKRLRVK
jgi:nucleoside-diphosphate-sugar epimerase